MALQAREAELVTESVQATVLALKTCTLMEAQIIEILRTILTRLNA